MLRHVVIWKLKESAEGKTKKEALKNIREAITLYLEPVDDDISLSPDAEEVEVAV